MKRVLVIEDEPHLALALVDALRAEGFEVLHAADGRRGLELALREDPDAILLDLMLPKLDGFQVLRSLREDRLSAPVLILSARGAEYDRIQGFEYGADDYIVKPFSMTELLLRLRAALARRIGATPGIDAERDGQSIRFGVVTIDRAAYSVVNDGVRHGLSRRELDLLVYLVEHEGETLDRLRILADVWDPAESPTTRTVDQHVLKLRKKVEPNPASPRHIVTVHGVGYRFQR